MTLNKRIYDRFLLEIKSTYTPLKDKECLVVIK